MNDIRVIHLTNVGFTIVDEDKFDELRQHKWRLNEYGHVGRRTMRNSVRKYYALHRTVNRTPPGVLTDHKNRIKIDNRACNLRNATPMQSAGNISLKRNARTTIYKGVTRSGNKWMARIGRGMKYLGHFSTPEEAATAYNTAAIDRWGEFANLNVINKKD
jgi:hypothetical protein